MTRVTTDYKAFEASSARNRRLLREEELILQVTEALSEVLARGGVSKTELAGKLGKSKGFVSQILTGSRNLTLRTIADVADALNCRVQIQVSPQSAAEESEILTIADSTQHTTVPMQVRAVPGFRVIRPHGSTLRSKAAFAECAA